MNDDAGRSFRDEACTVAICPGAGEAHGSSIPVELSEIDLKRLRPVLVTLCVVAPSRQRNVTVELRAIVRRFGEKAMLRKVTVLTARACDPATGPASAEGTSRPAERRDECAAVGAAAESHAGYNEPSPRGVRSSVRRALRRCAPGTLPHPMGLTFIFLMLVLKIPIFGLGYIVWCSSARRPSPSRRPVTVARAAAQPTPAPPAPSAPGAAAQPAPRAARGAAAAGPAARAHGHGRACASRRALVRKPQPGPPLPSRAP